MSRNMLTRRHFVKNCLAGTVLWGMSGCLPVMSQTGQEVRSKLVDSKMPEKPLGESDSLDLGSESVECATIETQGLAFELPADYEYDADDDTYYGTTEDGIYYQVNVTTMFSKGSSDWYIVALLDDMDTIENLLETTILADNENADVIMFGSKDYSTDELGVYGYFFYQSAQPETNLVTFIVIGEERAWMVAAFIGSKFGDDQAAIDLANQIAGSMTDKLETKKGKAALLGDR